MNLRSVRKKTRSVTNVQKITQAMQLVSAFKMRKAQEIALEAKPYQEFLTKSIRRFTYKLQANISPLLSSKLGSQKKRMIILVSTNKGLCGSFNFNLIRTIVKSEELKYSDFVVVGKRGASLINSFGGKILADFSSNLPLESVSAVFTYALEKYLAGEYSEVSVYFNKFISTLRYEPTQEKLLPFQANAQIEPQEEKFQYSVEPEPEEIVDSLLRNYVEEKIRSAIVESEAGEHSARMIAMKNATDNAIDVIASLTSLGNKLRQQKITYELLDMITAKESVEHN